jgi:hypothetical protein
MGNETALHDGKIQRDRLSARVGHSAVCSHSGASGFLGHKQQGADDVTHNDDCHIGWGIVCTLMMQFLATCRTFVTDLEIGSENLAFTASGATAGKPLRIAGRTSRGLPVAEEGTSRANLNESITGAGIILSNTRPSQGRQASRPRLIVWRLS